MRNNKKAIAKNELVKARWIEVGQLEDKDLLNQLLIKAAKQGDVRIGGFLLDAGCDINTYNINDQGQKEYTPLLFATAFNNPEFVQMLINRGCDIEARDNLGSTALMISTISGNRKANLAIATVDSSLRLRVGESDNRIFKILLKAGANTGIASYSNETPLRYAAQVGNYEMCELLLERSPQSMNIADKRGDTPLILAAARGHHDIVKLLVENGAAVDLLNKKDETATDLALRNGHEESFVIIANREELIAQRQEFLAQKARIENERQEQERAEAAIELHRKEIAESPMGKLQILVNQLGEDAISSTKAESTPNQMARVKKLIKLIEETELQKAAEPDIARQEELDFRNINFRGFTALHLAARFGRKEDVEKIIAKETDINAEGLSALGCAVAAKNTEVVRVFMNHPDIKFSTIKDGLETAIEFYNKDMVYLISTSPKTIDALAELSGKEKQALLESWKGVLNAQAKGKNVATVADIRKSIAILGNKAGEKAATLKAAKKRNGNDRGNIMKELEPENSSAKEKAADIVADSIRDNLAESSNEVEDSAASIEDNFVAKDADSKSIIRFYEEENEIQAEEIVEGKTLESEKVVINEVVAVNPPLPPEVKKDSKLNKAATEYVPSWLKPKPPEKPIIRLKGQYGHEEVYADPVKLPSGQEVHLRTNARNYDKFEAKNSAVKPKYPNPIPEIKPEDLDPEYLSEISGESLKAHIALHGLPNELPPKTNLKPAVSAALDRGRNKGIIVNK